MYIEARDHKRVVEFNLRHSKVVKGKKSYPVDESLFSIPIWVFKDRDEESYSVILTDYMPILGATYMSIPESKRRALRIKDDIKELSKLENQLIKKVKERLNKWHVEF